MKLIIDIPDEEYNQIKDWEDNITGYQTSLALYRAVRNGKPYDERPQGEWIDTGSGQECNVCHEIQYGYDNFRHFCANCGAKMRKGGAE